MAKADNVHSNSEKRLFFLSEKIDNETIGKICFELLYLLQDDDENNEKKKDFKREPIKIYINSPGGNLYDMWALIDIILNSKTPIYTYCTGCAMSAGFEIFLAGHKRFVSKNATLLYHQFVAGVWGKYLDIKQEVDEMDRAEDDIEKYVLSRTKISKERLKKVRTEKIDWYIHSDEVEKLGIAEVIK